MSLKIHLMFPVIPSFLVAWQWEHNYRNLSNRPTNFQSLIDLIIKCLFSLLQN
jgi:hypothetical protein